jgi:hypothetical protein
MLTPQDKANLELAVETLAGLVDDDPQECGQVMATHLFRHHPLLQTGVAQILSEFAKAATVNRTPNLFNQDSVRWFEQVAQVRF